MPGTGGLGPPGAGLGEVGGVQPGGEQHPEAVLCVGVPGTGGLGPPGAGLGEVGGVQPGGEEHPEAVLGAGVPGAGGLGPPGAGLGQLGGVQPICEQHPEAVLRVGVPGAGGAGPPGPGLGRLRRVQHVCEQHPEAVLGPGVPGFGGAGPPGPGRGRLRRVQALCEQHPEVVLRVGVPGFGGAGPPGAGRGRLRRVQHGGEQHPEVVLGAGVPGVGGAAARRHCDWDVSAQVGGDTNAQRVLVRRTVQEAAPSAFCHVPGGLVSLTVVGGYQIFESFVSAGPGVQPLGAKQGNLTFSRDRRAGPPERLVHFVDERARAGAVLLERVAGEGEQVRLRNGPGEPAACPVDADLDQGVQRGIGSCRVTVSA